MLGDPVRGPARLPRPGDDLARSLRDGEVHVWVVPLVSDGADEPRLEVLPRDESADMARFRSPRDTRRYGVSHAAARLILAAYAEREPADLEFEPGPAGKPHLTDTDLQHSLSHAGGLALLGVGRRRPLGVDVEVLRSLRGAEALKLACFTAGERMHLAAAGSDDELLRLWTREEAVAKATGEGLTRALDGFDVLTVRGQAGWHVLDLAPAPGYAGAVAVSDDVAAVVPVGWTGWGGRAPRLGAQR